MVLCPVDYHKQDYWEERFAHEDQFEWLGDFNRFAPFIERHVNKSDRILHLGCGNSDLALDMVNCGYLDITNVDYSATVVNRMRRRSQKFLQNCMGTFSGKVCLQWLTADCLTMTSHPELGQVEYDVVLDKTLADAVCCGDSEEHPLFRQLAQQVMQMLKPGGFWISISYSQHRSFEDQSPAQGPYRWQAQRYPIEAPKEHIDDVIYTPTVYHYCYVCQKVPVT
ncbi:hypothetical protein IWQ61_003103 [Dispira simplex]|nr:hypothetical protein IWQ61_003103 [Dispira simplex]